MLKFKGQTVDPKLIIMSSSVPFWLLKIFHDFRRTSFHNDLESPSRLWHTTDTQQMVLFFFLGFFFFCSKFCCEVSLVISVLESIQREDSAGYKKNPKGTWDTHDSVLASGHLNQKDKQVWLKVDINKWLSQIALNLTFP